MTEILLKLRNRQRRQRTCHSLEPPGAEWIHPVDQHCRRSSEPTGNGQLLSHHGDGQLHIGLPREEVDQHPSVRAVSSTEHLYVHALILSAEDPRW
jgi:hypothetical protein